MCTRTPNLLITHSISGGCQPHDRGFPGQPHALDSPVAPPLPEENLICSAHLFSGGCQPHDRGVPGQPHALNSPVAPPLLAGALQAAVTQSQPRGGRVVARGHVLPVAQLGGAGGDVQVGRLCA